MSNATVNHWSDMLAKAPAWLGMEAPRYTSYPSAHHFHGAVNAAQHADWLVSLGSAQSVSAYFHVPFCRELCWFCGCHTKMTHKDEPIEKYVRVMLEEITLIHQRVVGNGVLKQIHFGGGSPSLLSPAQLGTLLNALHTAFTSRQIEEQAIELDPRTTTQENIEVYGQLGFTRVSIGVQDFDARVQQAVNRIQPYEMVARVVEEVHAAGIHHINTDLIYGLPFQTRGSFEETLRKTVALQPSRIALFSYAHVPHVKKHQRLIDEAALPSDVEKLSLYRMATDFLLAQGYVAIGIDHFARADDSLAIAAQDGELRRNFQGYVVDTTDVLLGMGASAISQFPNGYTQNHSAVHEYSQRIQSGNLATLRGWRAAAEDAFRKQIIDEIMCYMTADIGHIAEQYGYDSAICDVELRRLQDTTYAAFVSVQDRVVTVHTPYRMACRAVAAVFDHYQSAPAGRYSKVS